MPIRFENQCGDKIPYDNRDDAITALKGFLRRKKIKGRLNVYRCDFCEKFHVGRPGVKKMRRK